MDRRRWRCGTPGPAGSRCMRTWSPARWGRSPSGRPSADRQRVVELDEVGRQLDLPRLADELAAHRVGEPGAGGAGVVRGELDVLFVHHGPDDVRLAGDLDAPVLVVGAERGAAAGDVRAVLHDAHRARAVDVVVAL